MTPGSALSLRSISKTFAGTRVLTDVALDLEPGEVLGLVGENGSGKSTLVKIITGYHSPDGGAIGRAWGRPLSFPVDPTRLGVAAIHQDMGLVPEMTVLENMGVSVGYGAAHFHPVRWRSERGRCAEALHRTATMNIEPDALVGTLTSVEQAMVALARATRQLGGESDNQIFILDEPTAYLSGPEADRVMELIRTVARRGASVIFISHHLQEVLDNCDRVIVLRDGHVAMETQASECSPMKLVSNMLGRDVEGFYPDRLVPRGGGEPALTVSRLTGKVVEDLSFEVAKGEFLGVTGLAGMGQEELPYLLAGVTKARAGSVTLGAGEPLGESPGSARRAGVALVPANRQRDGLWLEATASENLSLPVLGRYFSRGWLDRRGEARRSQELMQTFGVVPTDDKMVVKSFSGGNQQKLVLAKWLQDPPDVVLLDEPTQGVDAGARRQILTMLRDVAAHGAAVVLFSSDLEQVAEMCTRVLVLARGRVSATVAGADVSEEGLLSLCQGAAA